MSSGPGVGPPPPGGDVDRASTYIAVCWTGIGITLAAVILRCHSRIMVKALNWDDYWMVITEVLVIVSTILTTVIAAKGGFRHLYYLDPNEIPLLLKLNWIAQPIAIFAFATSKMSIAILILRVMGTSLWRRWLLYFVIFSSFVVAAVGSVLTFVQCKPSRALWTPSLAGTAKCWNPAVQTRYAVFNGSFNGVVDVVLAILPITIFYKLNMSLRKRVGLCALLGTGLLAAVSAAIKTTHLPNLTARGDFTWSTFDIWLWSEIELYILVVCASLPTMRPLFIKIFGGLATTLSASRDRYGRSRSSSGKRGHSSRGNSRGNSRGHSYLRADVGNHPHHHQPGGITGGGGGTKGLLQIPGINNLKSESTSKKSWLSGPSTEDGDIDTGVHVDGDVTDMTPLSTLPVPGTFVTSDGRGGNGSRSSSFGRPPSSRHHHNQHGTHDYFDTGTGRTRGGGAVNVEGGVRIGVDEILVSNTIEVRDERGRSCPRVKNDGGGRSSNNRAGGTVINVERDERDGREREVNSSTPEGSLDDRPRDDRDMV
ncbi:MAG: hypothetical protein M1823_005967 [Watsoniomyces obsoletus]|nr:MAG: hypothetical protein M1823_005967 [Watsoniomyces obsoletus]